MVKGCSTKKRPEGAYPKQVGAVTREEAAVGMKASEVGDWLRRMASKRDHREVLRDDYLVVRPGPNFDRFMTGLAAGQPTPTASSRVRGWFHQT